MRSFLHKLKTDLSSLFLYPKVSGADWAHKEERYWDARRPAGESILTRWQKARAEIAAASIRSGATVLDVGCGDGSILNYLRDVKSISGIGVDNSEKMISLVRSLGFKGMVGDLQNPRVLVALPSADHILAFEILEHLHDPEMFLQSLLQHARVSVFVSVPNTGYWTHRVRLMLGRFPLQWVVYPGEHVRFWTVRDFIWWLRALGHEVRFVRTYQGIPLLNLLFPKLFGQGIIAEIKAHL